MMQIFKKIYNFRQCDFDSKIALDSKFLNDLYPSKNFYLPLI